MKPIVLTQAAKDNALEIFKKLLESAQGDTDLKINITTETLLKEQGVEKPTVFVSTVAYIKMTTLINSSDKELAWYGVATRVNKNYFIADILVYPQTVTSATVDADEEKCAKWFMELPDEVSNNLKFQGHSHVGMSATPSGRDTNNWQQFVNLLKPNEIYIFCIGNKRNEFYWNIYDKSINVFFENRDITMVVVDDKGNSLSEWAKESIKKYIVTETPTVTSFGQTQLNGHFYNTAPVSISKESKVANSKVQQAINAIPKHLTNSVEYEIETDSYYADTMFPGSRYNHLFQCFVMDGDDFRARYASAVTTTKLASKDEPKSKSKSKAGSKTKTEKETKNK